MGFLMEEPALEGGAIFVGCSGFGGCLEGRRKAIDGLLAVESIVSIRRLY